MNVLELKNVSKYYQNGDALTKALDDVSFCVKEGELLVISGRSGSGKSTLLHILGLLDDASEGKVYFEGHDVTKLSKKQQASLRKRKIGYVFQSNNLIPSLTVYENIIFPLTLDHLPVDTRYVDELLDALHLTKYRNALPANLSGGQRQRIALIRALVKHPSVILCDEPTGNLDSISGQEVMDVILQSKYIFHQTVIIVSHDASIAGYGEKLIKIEDGRIVI